ncbi:hypothetical protein CFP56_000699 [Quercus suber]|uniref:Uncharacterized protein n=1 Tax=Quercus suber TaxID=58331 RepID=A0AAW0IPM8_QUESU
MDVLLHAIVRAWHSIGLSIVALDNTAMHRLASLQAIRMCSRLLVLLLILMPMMIRQAFLLVRELIT